MDAWILIPSDFSLVLSVKNEEKQKPTFEMGASIWTTRSLPAGMIFYPDQGILRRERLEIYGSIGEKNEKSSFGCRDEIIEAGGMQVRRCNWIRFLKTSTDFSLVNMIAVRLNGIVVYQTTKTILANTELIACLNAGTNQLPLDPINSISVYNPEIDRLIELAKRGLPIWPMGYNHNFFTRHEGLVSPAKRARRNMYHLDSSGNTTGQTQMDTSPDRTRSSSNSPVDFSRRPNTPELDVVGDSDSDDESAEQRKIVIDNNDEMLDPGTLTPSPKRCEKDDKYLDPVTSTPSSKREAHDNNFTSPVSTISSDKQLSPESEPDSGKHESTSFENGHSFSSGNSLMSPPKYIFHSKAEPVIRTTYIESPESLGKRAEIPGPSSCWKPYWTPSPRKSSPSLSAPYPNRNNSSPEINNRFSIANLISKNSQVPLDLTNVLSSPKQRNSFQVPSSASSSPSRFQAENAKSQSGTSPTSENSKSENKSTDKLDTTLNLSPRGNVSVSLDTSQRKRERRWLPCEVCGKKFDRPSLLRRHMRVHTGEKPHACDVCGKAFSTSSSLNTHRRIHSGEKPHQCKICGKKFTASSNLYYHRMTHNKEKPHKCTLCSKSFPTPGDLKSHMYVHNGSWPFKCHICDRGFSKQTNLKNHVLLHTGDKPHECDLCGKRFALQCNLKTHLKTHEDDPQRDCSKCDKKFLPGRLSTRECIKCAVQSGHQNEQTPMNDSQNGERRSPSRESPKAGTSSSIPSLAVPPFEDTAIRYSGHVTAGPMNNYMPLPHRGGSVPFYPSYAFQNGIKMNSFGIRPMVSPYATEAHRYANALGHWPH